LARPRFQVPDVIQELKVMLFRGLYFLFLAWISCIYGMISLVCTKWSPQAAVARRSSTGHLPWLCSTRRF
jgi:hypothetical protein